MRFGMPLAIMVLLTGSGCMDPLTDYDECVRIETARCDLKDQCRIRAPVHFKSEFEDFEYDNCIAYLKENCRVRQIEADGWRDGDIVLCVNAILALNPDGCTTLTPRVDETEALPECWFIESGDTDLPDASPVDSGADASDTNDAGPDAA